MPFGKKQDPAGNTIDFDYVYNQFIRKVIEQCELMPLRADEEMIGGIIQKPMYERLILCDYAIADLTTANANVFYELGIRYAARPYTTFPIFEAGSKPPFDLNDVRCFPYTLEEGKIKDVEQTVEKLVDYIKGIRDKKTPDSPIYQLLDGIQFTHALSHEKVEMLRERTEFNESLREELQAIIKSTHSHKEKTSRIQAIENKLGNKGDWDISTCIDVLLAYRSIEAFEEMAHFIESLPKFMKKTILIREQYGFALNRAEKKDEAIQVLQELIDEYGPSSETCGILGRVYKDQYLAFKKESPIRAAGYLNKAVETYLQGYKSDMRDFYPGVNAVNLMVQKKDPRAADLAKVVEFSVTTHLERKSKRVRTTLASNFDDYWPYATLLELAFIQGDEKKATDYFSQIITVASEKWQWVTTANNLKALNLPEPWAGEIIQELLRL